MTHCTLYGDSLRGATPEALARLDKYDYLIVSPAVYARVPDGMKSKCLVYFSFFCWPRFMAAEGDWQPGPGDLGMKSIQKGKGGESYLYTVSWQWAAGFMGAMMQFANANRGKFAGFFLEDWQRSHSWWGVAGWQEITAMSELPAIMDWIEQAAAWISTNFGATGEAQVVALSGHPEDFMRPTTRWYAESFGSTWQPVIPVIQQARPGMFIQVNSADFLTRWMGARLAAQIGGSLGCQPQEGVLSYDDIEDIATWPL